MKLKVKSIENCFPFSKHHLLTNNSVIALFAVDNSYNSLITEIKNIVQNHQLPFKINGNMFIEILKNHIYYGQLD